MKTTAFVSVVALVALSGCVYDRPVGLDRPNFGEAVNSNIAASTINPMAPEDRGPLTLDAQRAAIAQGRYVTDMVEPPALVGSQAQTGTGTGQGTTATSAGTTGAR